MTYYGYKLEYFLLAAGWAAGSVAVVAIVDRVEADSRAVASAVAAVLAIGLAWPLATWPNDNYREWLTARGVYGPDPSVACAVRVARHARASPSRWQSARGAGRTTHSRRGRWTWGSAAARPRPSRPAVLGQPDPATWPWATTDKPFLVVSGPVATTAQTDAVLAAARAAGDRAQLVTSCDR